MLVYIEYRHKHSWCDDSTRTNALLNIISCSCFSSILVHWLLYIIKKSTRLCINKNRLFASDLQHSFYFCSTNDAVYTQSHIFQVRFLWNFWQAYERVCFNEERSCRSRSGNNSIIFNSDNLIRQRFFHSNIPCSRLLISSHFA